VQAVEGPARQRIRTAFLAAADEFATPDRWLAVPVAGTLVSGRRW
jgi:hypothetical protein